MGWLQDELTLIITMGSYEIPNNTITMQNKLEWLTLGDMIPNVDHSSGCLFCSKQPHTGGGSSWRLSGRVLLVTQSKINLGSSAKNFGKCSYLVSSVCHGQLPSGCHRVKKKGRASEIRLRFQMTLQSCHHQTGMVLWENRHTDQWNRELKSRARCIWSV